MRKEYYASKAALNAELPLSDRVQALQIARKWIRGIEGQLPWNFLRCLGGAPLMKNDLLLGGHRGKGNIVENVRRGSLLSKKQS